jgi:sugar phosphate isomerase/epimerase
MKISPLTDLSRLCIHTITTKPWNIDEAAKYYSEAGIGGITVWRDTLEGRNIRETGEMLRDHGLKVVSLSRGGFFANYVRSKRESAIGENRRAIEEAYELGTRKIIIVCGADPQQSLEDSRKQIFEGLSSVLDDAASAGIVLAIEPLHPMFADTRSAINTIAQANSLAESLNSPAVGVVIDVYHLWWDPQLENGIKSCGKNNNLAAYHISDWKSPTTDLLNDRELMGEGCIPLRSIRSWVEKAGFDGYIEVEIFSNNYWNQDQSQFLKKIISSYREFA